MKIRNNQSQAGYIALSTVLVILVVIVTIGISSSLTSISDTQQSLAGKKSDESINITEGCIEDALLEINETNSVSPSVTLPEGTCSVTTNSHVGSTWNITVTSTNEGYTKSIRVKAERASTVTITSWKEV